MLNIGKITVRDIKELQDVDTILPKNKITPLKKRKNAKSVEYKKNISGHKHDNETVTDNVANTTTLTKASRKKFSKSTLKETPSNQKRIDSYFTSCQKTYEIKVVPTTIIKTKEQSARTNTKSARNTSRNRSSPRRPRTRRRRLFTDSAEQSSDNMSNSNLLKETKNQKIVECITIDSDSDLEINVQREKENVGEQTATAKHAASTRSMPDNTNDSKNCSSAITASSLSFGQRMSKTSCEITKSISDFTTSSSNVPRRKYKPCPPYKIIENTTFAVDAFQFGYIENVTHYFLTHFHADHYIGLTKSFSMPLYMSPITARLLRTFIRVQDQYIHELELNQTYKIENMEVTALDANHCPGSILLVFKFDTGKCILHTGDFRASPEMESEPIFWNNYMHTIYLDTTYLSDKYAFCTQYESIMKAQDLIEKFQEKHAEKRVLYICGAYIIGKEKFWSSIAEKYDMKVWAEGNRSKALKAINDERFNCLLVDDPNEANMHVLPMGKVSYLELVEYYKLYELQYDTIFAIRPSGWEKNSKPRYGSKINLVGIEYSEHSSYLEMQRFVKFLKPEQVISTVPAGKDLMKTSEVPKNWYKYDKLKVCNNYQPTIDSFMGKTAQKKSSIRLPNVNKGGVESSVSPLKLNTTSEVNCDLDPEQELPIITSSENLEALSRKNKKANKIKNSPVNVARTKTKYTAISITNSSEDFEKPEFVIKRKTPPRNKKLTQDKDNSSNLTQIKSQRNKRQLTPKNTNIKADNSTTSAKQEKKAKKVKESPVESKVSSDEIKKANETAANCTSLHYSTDDELNNIPTEMKTATNEALNNLNSPKKIIETTNASSGYQTRLQKTIQRNNSQSELSSTKSRRNYLCKSKDSTSTDENIKQILEIPNSQKRMTRSSAFCKNSVASIDCQGEAEKEFQSKLLKLTQQNDALQYKAITNFNTSQANPIFNSTTDSTTDGTSTKEVPIKALEPKEIKINSSESSDSGLYKFDYSMKLVRNKRHALNKILSPLKRTKKSIDTQTILNTILEQKEDFDGLNCSQLAGLVMETVDKQNPDYCKSHIPVELLSDADDDWI